MKNDIDHHINRAILLKANGEFLPSISIDNVIFGFHEGKVKVLLNKFTVHNRWMLPGGFLYKNESVDDAAYRILNERTGLEDTFLTQFHTFGDNKRTNIEENKTILQQYKVDYKMGKEDHWLLQRYVSVGYYAFVEFFKVKINCTNDEEVKWFNLDEIPELYSDHNKIITIAVSEIVKYMAHIPIGYELLPKKFTMSELRMVYEGFLGEKLDRRNFQRKMLSMGFLNKLDEKSKKVGVKPAVLFTFDKEKYTKSISNFLTR